jgi:hypothetical protein
VGKARSISQTVSLEASNEEGIGSTSSTARNVAKGWGIIPKACKTYRPQCGRTGGKLSQSQRATAHGLSRMQGGQAPCIARG